MTIRQIKVQCTQPHIDFNDIYIEISRIYDGSKVYNSPTGYFGNYERKGNASWTERLPKLVKNEDTYLILCLNKQFLAQYNMKYTTFRPCDFAEGKPDNLCFEVDVYKVCMEVGWE